MVTILVFIYTDSISNCEDTTGVTVDLLSRPLLRLYENYVYAYQSHQIFRDIPYHSWKVSHQPATGMFVREFSDQS